MGRRPCCSKVGLKKGAWTVQEDQILAEYIRTHGEGKWRDLPQRAGLKRCGKSCRLRWLNYLRPGIKLGNISVEEEDLIIRLHQLLGNRWSLIAGRLPGRTDNEIKNYWNTTLKKKLPVLAHNNAPVKLEKKKSSPRSENLPGPARTSTQKPHRVIRTKAVKCTKIFSDPQQPESDEVLIPQNEPSASKYVGSSTSSSSSLEEDYFMDLWMDFDIGELLSDDALNLDAKNHKYNAEGNLEEYGLTFDFFPNEAKPNDFGLCCSF